tara:strand:- start:226 stop:462 length:237 start_codon:yes stop_codon:yes gene_type:complete
MSKTSKNIKTTIKHLQKKISELKDEIKEIEIKIDRAWSDKSLEKLYKKKEEKRRKLKFKQERLMIFEIGHFMTNKENK